jgi:hypothetical protein
MVGDINSNVFGAMEGRDWQKARTVAVVRIPVSSRVVYKENT